MLSGFKKLGQNAVAVYVTMGIRIGFGLLTTAILARQLSIEEYGTLATAIGLSVITWTICDYGVSLRGQRIIAARSGPRAARFVADTVIFRSALGLIVLLCSVSLPLIHPGFTWHDGPLIFAAVLCGWSTAITPGWVLSQQRRNIALVPSDVLAASITLLLAVSYIHGRANLWMFFCGPIVGNITLLSWFLVNQPPAPRMAGVRIIVWLRIFAPGSVLRFALTLVSIGAVFVYSMNAQVAVLAIYVAADRVLRYAITGICPVFSLSAPYVFATERKNDNIARMFAAKYLLLLIAIGALGGVMMAICAPFCVHLIFGSRFDESAGVMRILAFALPFYMIENALLTQLLIVQKQEIWSAVIVVTVACLLVGVVLTGVASTPTSFALLTVGAEAAIATGGMVCFFMGFRGFRS